MKRTFLALFTLIAAMALPAADTAAQQIDSPYRFLDHSQFLGVYGGYLGASEGRLNAGPQPAPIGGVSWGIRLSGPFTVGAELGFMPTQRTVRDTVFVEADSTFAVLGETDMNLLVGMANLRFNITGARTWNALQPFLKFGAGLAVDLSGTSELEEDLAENARFDYGTSFAGQLGAGVDWFPSERLSVRVEGRNLLWKMSVPEAFLLTQGGRTLPRSEWEQNYVVAAGLFFHF